jgi:hypothetical protein
LKTWNQWLLAKSNPHPTLEQTTHKMMIRFHVLRIVSVLKFLGKNQITASFVMKPSGSLILRNPKPAAVL